MRTVDAATGQNQICCKTRKIAIFLIFFAVLDSKNKYLNLVTAQNRSKNLPNLRIPQMYLQNPEQFVESTNK